MAMDSADLGKAAAARYAAQLVPDGAVIGLGTGSTAEHFLRALGERVRGAGLRIAGVPTSEVTAALARQQGVTLTTLEEHPRLDLAVDGADAVDDALDLIKGHGGALLRERIVAAAAARFVVIVDEGKLVDTLCHARGVPVEVVPFGWSRTRAELERLGAVTNLRLRPGGGEPEAPFVTDGGHYIVDCRFGRIDDAPALGRALKLLTGVVDHGLFVGMAHEVVVGAASGQVRVIARP